MTTIRGFMLGEQPVAPLIDSQSNQRQGVILALIGDYPGVGKDTAAGYLVNGYQFHRATFSDRLYREVSEAFGVSVELLKNRGTKETLLPELALANCRDGSFVQLYIRRPVGPIASLTAPHSPREILRFWGTEYRRAQDENYWCGPTFEDVSAHPEWNWVFTDPRLGNELMRASRIGKTLRLARPQAKPEIMSTHASEILARLWPEDYLVDNSAEDGGERMFRQLDLIVMAEMLS